MTPSITKLLEQIHAPGTFAARLRAPSDALAIEVKGVGPLKFPITAAVARKLRAVAQPSPFGLREQTLHDRSVRDTWEIGERHVKIAQRQWAPVLASHVRALQAELGLPEDREIEAVFDKLLIYEEGQLFKSHQDSEKDDEMVATLVVILPSQYSGGTVTVEHRGQKKVFRRVEHQGKNLSLLAFYADCHHAVSPIQSGVRVALTYQLRLGERSTATYPKVHADVVDRLARDLRHHFDTPVVRPYSLSEPARPQRFVFLLDHEYTQRSLSWSRLKNGDRARVEALRAAAESFDGECFLALAEVHETWLCEDNYDPHDRYGRRERVARAAAQYELIELNESRIALDHWLDSEGQRIEGIPGGVSDDELYFTKPSCDMDPFKSEHEGYQGNYGNTLDRWYHRAAFVMWPRANTFALRAQASPQWAVAELLALPPTSRAELEARINALLPRWKSTASGGKDASFFASLVKLAARIHDPALAHGWLAPLGLHRLTTKQMRRGLAAVIDQHGSPWAKELIEGWTKRQRWGTPSWAPLLADLCADLRASGSKACAELADWLLEREAKIAVDRCAAAFKQPHPWLDLEVFGDEAKHLAHVLAAGASMSFVTDTLDTLLRREKGAPTHFLALLMQACVGRSAELRAYVSGSSLHRECAAKLGAVLSAPPRADDDWVIYYPISCSCTDCKVLAEFLVSARAELDWPLAKMRRQHIHHTVDSATLPVTHTTLHIGSPHVLQLRKDRSLFSRERAYRAHVQELLDALPDVE